MRYVDVINGMADAAPHTSFPVDTSVLAEKNVAMVVFPEEGTPWVEFDPFNGREQDAEIISIAEGLLADAERQLDEPEEPLPPEEEFEQLRTMKMAEINSAYQADMDQILDKYPDAETLTFDKQDREARDWQAWVDGGSQGDAPSTPLISNLAEGRQMPKEELVARIITKSDAWLQLCGHATGKRQYLEDRVMAATTPEELEAINW